MTYPTSIDSFVTKIDKNASGWYISDEYFNIPQSPYTLYLDHVPNTSATTVILPSGGGVVWTEDLTGSPAAGQYYVDYDVGKVDFNAADVGTALEAQYDTLGDDIMAEHINSLQNTSEGVEVELGLGVKGAWTDLSERLDNMGNELALNASQISCVTPAGTSQTTVQGHISSIPGTADDDNPHGITWDSIFNTDGSVYNTAYGMTIGDLSADTLSASGNYLNLNWKGPDSDTFIFFYDGGETIGQWIKWDDDDSRFETSADLLVHGGITASGNRIGIGAAGPIQDQWLHFYDGEPTAQWLKWDEGGSLFELSAALFVHGDITASGNMIVGVGDTGVDYTLTFNGDTGDGIMTWMEGETEFRFDHDVQVTGNITPEASGTRSLGTPALAFGEGHFDTLLVPEMKVGTDQTDAGAGFMELWADSNDDRTVKLGS